MNPYFTDFYNNWSGKVDTITSNDLSSVFDRYMTLFVIYNNLYNQIPDKLISSGQSVPDRIYDNKAATEFVIKFLGADEFLNELSSKNLNTDVLTIINLIDQETFHIKIHYGQYNRNDDLKILADLRSDNNLKKATAILKVIYHVRCNMFHGSKDFQEHQRILIEPLTKILKVVNPFLFNKLSE